MALVGLRIRCVTLLVSCSATLAPLMVWQLVALVALLLVTARNALIGVLKSATRMLRFRRVSASAKPQPKPNVIVSAAINSEAKADRPSEVTFRPAIVPAAGPPPARRTLEYKASSADQRE